MKGSELRQDLVSSDWILIAPGRGKRPDQFVSRGKSKKAPLKGCLFENPEKAAGGKPIVVYPKGNAWRLMIIPNKFPAVVYKEIKVLAKKVGPYSVIPGIGYHDLLITRDHDRNFAKLALSEANLVWRYFQNRYLMFLPKKNLSYVAVFHNWGAKAGASVYHPHYQIVAIPVVPPDVEHSLQGAKSYFQKYKKCVHCEMIAWEKKQKKRVIFENKGAIAFAPFASSSPFEIRVFPKKHLPFFEDTSKEDLAYAVGALQTSLKKIEKALKEPDYNFFLHTAPLKNKRQYLYYHWHIEVTPKVTIDAGFELETGMKINVVDPDLAAKFLKHA